MEKENTMKEVFHPSMFSVDVELKNATLWKQFHKEGTEMIITKSGRRMFPSVRLSVKGLDPDARYFVLLEVSLSSNHRYKFSSAEWVSGGGAEPQTHSSTRLYVHPDSPATGSAWMAHDVSFHRVKLTNNTLDKSGNLVLTSMHKYQPRIHVIKASDILALHWSPTVTVTFPETEFIAVTAYQNEKITKLKIDNNPFAKGFRENGQAKTKRKWKNEEEENKAEPETEECDKRTCPDTEERTKIAEIVEECEDRTKRSTAVYQDDSGVSVGSVSPPPSPRSTAASIPLRPTPTISDVPPPPFYPHSLWPFPLPITLHYQPLYFPPPTYYRPYLPLELTDNTPIKN